MTSQPHLHQHIIFDMDDTLIYCNKYFEAVLEDFTRLLRHFLGKDRLTAEEIRAKQVEIDVAGVHQVGFASHHFPESMVETYRYFATLLGHPISQIEEARITKLGLSVYDQLVEPYPGMIETLDVLKAQGHDLYLYTGGEAAIQQRKIDQMKLDVYFGDRIYIRQHKNVEALEEIIALHQFDRSRTWMIGNSLRTDIEPAIKAGINCIYLKQPDEWVYNIIELKPAKDTTMYTITSLQQVPEVIAENIAVKHKRTL
ncbi:HAD family hydrolase [Paenibacillus yonginensis]|uniref:HAD family hydrolase n=1 Tax=Paenibacillus yonginensis TaxID=1462996 RepID=A0A1B1MZL0_9BACL|nr:HAD family hydrolase [Paenibacillus yonginensis]ANS74613.1 HAD family hydrolase [Paenibacillus yonginensis]